MSQLSPLSISFYSHWHLGKRSSKLPNRVAYLGHVVLNGWNLRKVRGPQTVPFRDFTSHPYHAYKDGNLSWIVALESSIASSALRISNFPHLEIWGWKDILVEFWGIWRSWLFVWQRVKWLWIWVVVPMPVLDSNYRNFLRQELIMDVYPSPYTVGFA